MAGVRRVYITNEYMHIDFIRDERDNKNASAVGLNCVLLCVVRGRDHLVQLVASRVACIFTH